MNIVQPADLRLARRRNNFDGCLQRNRIGAMTMTTQGRYFPWVVRRSARSISDEQVRSYPRRRTIERHGRRAARAVARLIRLNQEYYDAGMRGRFHVGCADGA